MSGLTENEALEKPKSKYNKYKVAPKEERTIDGIVFDSKAEAYFYAAMTRIFKLTLELQPKFVLSPKVEHPVHGSIPSICYIGDFRIGNIVFDVKGVETDKFIIKKHLLSVMHPEITLVLVKKVGVGFTYFIYSEKAKNRTSLEKLGVISGRKPIV